MRAWRAVMWAWRGLVVAAAVPLLAVSDDLLLLPEMITAVQMIAEGVLGEAHELVADVALELEHARGVRHHVLVLVGPVVLVQLDHSAETHAAETAIVVMVRVAALHVDIVLIVRSGSTIVTSSAMVVGVPAATVAESAAVSVVFAPVAWIGSVPVVPATSVV